MFKFYYRKQIYIKLIKQLIKSKFNFENNLIVNVFNNSFKSIFFKVVFINVKNKIFLVSIPTFIDYGISFIMKSVLEDFFKSKFKFRFINKSGDFFNNLREWINVKWCVKGKFDSFFDQVDLFLVGQYLYFYIQDIFILNLYFRFFSVGYWLKNTTILFYSYFGKKYSLGYLLVDLYFFELDKYLKNYIKYFNFFFLKKGFSLKNSVFFYVRIGFLWFLGICGSFQMVLFLRKKFFSLLFSFLRISLKKQNTQIISLLGSSFFLWGVEIKSLHSGIGIQILCPLQKLLLIFNVLGFLKYYKKKLIPCAQRKWLSLVELKAKIPGPTQKYIQ